MKGGRSLLQGGDGGRVLRVGHVVVNHKTTGISERDAIALHRGRDENILSLSRCCG